MMIVFINVSYLEASLWLCKSESFKKNMRKRKKRVKNKEEEDLFPFNLFDNHTFLTKATFEWINFSTIFITASITSTT